MPELMRFLRNLTENNNKPWFDEHKGEYLAVKQYRDALAIDLLHALQELDSDLNGLGINDITYRIYQDMRFHDREPYKNWVGIYLAKRGKKSPYAGYYLHIEPYFGKFFLCTGLYRDDKTLTKSVREDLSYSGQDFIEAVDGAKADDWYVDFDGALKKLPADAPADSPCADLFRLKHYLLVKDIDEKYLLSSRLVERLKEEFAPTVSWVKLLNRAVDYAIDEWGYNIVPGSHHKVDR